MLHVQTLKCLALAKSSELIKLHDANLYDTACYLAGYTVEYALKARICDHLDVEIYPEREYDEVFLTHHFDRLIFLGGLSKKLKDHCEKSFEFNENWDIISSWDVDWRYRQPGTCMSDDSLKIIEALNCPENGVLSWIMKNWKTEE